MTPVLSELIERAPVLTDGAWGTELQARGLAVGDCPDAWNLTRPADVGAVAKSYVEAGSRVVLTNTFGANRPALARYGLADRVAEINRAGAEISRRAAGAKARVFASLGPTGRMLVTGETSRDELFAAFAEQAAALAEGGADALLIETMSDPVEAAIAVSAAKETGLAVAACMVFSAGKNRDRTMMGATPEDCAAALEEAGADVIGANCGQGIEGFIPICHRLKAATGRPLWIKANAGIPQMEGGRTVYRTSPEEFAGQAPALVAAGAAFIGGCCGTDPRFIRALAAVLVPPV